MHNRTRPGEDELIDLMVEEVRGPRQNALFAAWLILRTASDLASPGRFSERNHRRRLDALRRRINALTLPVPLRHAMHEIIEVPEAPAPVSAVWMLDRLIGAMRETIGDPPAEALQPALRAAREWQAEAAAGAPRPPTGRQRS